MLRIGSLELGLRAVQAALSGFSDRPMRLVARRHGLEYALNEVVLDRLILAHRRERLDPEDHPIGGQLMGSRPAEFARAAAEMVEAGYDVVDLNFGCPVRKVLGRCRGGWLLSEPATALEIVRAVMGAVAGRRPVTVKMRRGYDDSAESERRFWTILDGALALGVAAATVHGRTVKQRYVGPSDWSFLARVKRHVGERTILGSGDLFTAEAVKRMLDETGVDGASVARGAIGHPFIFEECRALLAGEPLPPPPSVAEQRAALEEHLALAIEEYGEDRGGRGMLKFGLRYADLHPMGPEVRRAFLGVRDVASFLRVLAEWYDSRRVWPPIVRQGMPSSLVAAGAAME
ncbi:MAG: tRNA-dihydrouridine synthase [Planctomycetes bacterium]|nr:tRNA-dihydrouridine synthase [Planctomycetota bacterium]